MKPNMNPYSTTSCLEALNMLEPFLQCMLNCINDQNYIEQPDLENVCNYQLFHLYKKNLCSYTSASIWKILPDLTRE